LTNFFRSLFWMCEIGFVCRLIASMLNNPIFDFRSGETLLRLEIISKLSEHEAWVPLNFPNFSDLKVFLTIKLNKNGEIFLSKETLKK
jgi:hypothetical protein